MKVLILILSILSTPLFITAQTTSISGVINSYTNVTGISGNTIDVGSSANFSIGDKVLIIQMQGATIDESNSASFGDITNLNDAGNYEFSSICAVSNATEIVVNGIQRTYDPSGIVQIVRVPVYNSAQITAPLTAAPWDGTTGGVLAFECNRTLTMNDEINLQGSGFRGGEVITSSYSCSWFSQVTDYHYPISSGQGAKKGEGIALYISNKTGGRGAQANGGGGGNDHNAGGGGGGNAGNGGQGGERIASSTFTCGATAPGIGGKLNTYSNALNKLFLGGGGGAGHENNVATATPGGNGGGIVIISTDTLITNGNEINVNGDDISALSFDGSGGGGAGGSVLLNVSTYSGTLVINANGGDGGSVANSGASNCNGPGGGGGGGIVWVNQMTLPANINFNANGGAPGIMTATGQANCTVGSTNNATVGNAGFSLTNLTFSETSCSIPLTVVSNTICGSDSLFVGGAWQSSAGIYYDTLSVGCCDSIIETTLSFLTALTSTINQTICNGESITVNGTTYATTVSGATETFTNIGPFGCDSIVTINLTVLPPKTGNITTTVCAGESIVVNGMTYSSTISGVTEVFNNIGPYNCDSTVTINLTVLPPKTGNITDTICEGESIVVNGTTYSNTVTGATETFTNIGPYGCDSTVTINLFVNTIDATVTNTSPTLMANQSSANYQWVNCPSMSPISGETNQSFTASITGDYAVIVSNTGCSDTSDCSNIIVSGILENSFGNQFQLFPNPTDGNFTVDLGENYASIKTKLVSLDGKIVSTFTHENSQLLNLSISEPSGIYLLIIESENRKATIRVVKE